MALSGHCELRDGTGWLSEHRKRVRRLALSGKMAPLATAKPPRKRSGRGRRGGFCASGDLFLPRTAANPAGHLKPSADKNRHGSTLSQTGECVRRRRGRGGGMGGGGRLGTRPQRRRFSRRHFHTAQMGTYHLLTVGAQPTHPTPVPPASSTQGSPHQSPSRALARPAAAGSTGPWHGTASGAGPG